MDAQFQNIQFEVYNKLRGDGITNFDADKAIFGIAAIGLIIGKEKLNNFAHDSFSMEERKHFENDVILSKVEWDGAGSIKWDALNLISKQISSKSLTEIIEVLINCDLLDIVLHMDFIDSYNKVKEKECSYPVASVSWINDLVIQIIKEHGGNNIFNCDCGFGDFIEKISKNKSFNKITGYTFNKLTFTISKIRCFFSSNDIDIKYSEHDYPLIKENYDIIYNSFPIGCSYNVPITYWTFPPIPQQINRKDSSELMWIIRAIQNLTIEGLVVALVSNGTLYNERDKYIRKYLVNNNLIKTIIFLPPGILPFLGMDVSLILLDNNLSYDESIKMINAKTICHKQRRNKFFEKSDIDQIITLYKTTEESDLLLEVSCDAIVENDYNLGINKYIRSNYTINDTNSLKEVTECIFRGYQIKASEFNSISTEDKEETEYRMINVSDVEAEGLVKSELQPVIIADKRKYEKYLVEDNDIIITAKNTTVKTAIYNKRDYKTILTGNLIVIRVNTEKINPYYLKAFLDSELGERMIDSISTGTTVRSINPNNLKNMVIPLPSMDIQNRIAEEYKKNLKEIKELLQMYKKKIERKRNIYNELIGN